MLHSKIHVFKKRGLLPSKKYKFSKRIFFFLRKCFLKKKLWTRKKIIIISFLRKMCFPKITKVNVVAFFFLLFSYNRSSLWVLCSRLISLSLWTPNKLPFVSNIFDPNKLLLSSFLHKQKMRKWWMTTRCNSSNLLLSFYRICFCIALIFTD